MYHTNLETGEVGPCGAQKGRCPYGPENHYSTEAEAQEAYQKHLYPYKNMTTPELEATEVALFQEHLKSGAPVSDQEYQRHYEYIRRIRRGPSTHKLYSNRGKYIPEREALQRDIVETVVESYRKVPREGKVLFLGGVPGSGKSTLLATLPQYHGYATINPDELKPLMVARGMTPEIPGVLPLETDELIRYEAGVISDQIFKKLAAKGHNLMVDRTIPNENQVLKPMKELEVLGYSTFEGIFVDSSLEVAYARTQARHRSGLDKFFKFGEGIGERPIPGSAFASAVPSDPQNFRSRNGEAFKRLQDSGVFSWSRVFPN